MEIRDIITELEGAAIWEAAGISALETTRFEPELDARAQEAIAASRKRVAALGEAVKLLREWDLIARLQTLAPKLQRLRDALAAFRPVAP